MPLGTCDPASRGMGYNEGAFAVDNGAVEVYYRYGWDGTSVMPDCIGPLLLVRGTNNAAVTYYAHFKGRKGTWRRITLDPGVVKDYTQSQLAKAGFQDNTDLEGLYITTSPDPPTVTLI